VTPTSQQKCAIFGYNFKSQVIFDETNAAVMVLGGLLPLRNSPLLVNFGFYFEATTG
jgi:hypothetical protein